jgi:hypothetical protein
MVEIKDLFSSKPCQLPKISYFLIKIFFIFHVLCLVLFFQIILSFGSCSVRWLGAGKPLARAPEAVRFASLLLSQLP